MHFAAAAAVVLGVVMGVARAAPQFGAYNPRFLPLTPQGYVPIVSQNYDLNPIDNSYNFNYVSGDGSERSEAGVIANPRTQLEGTAVQGYYYYTSPDGTPNTVNYVADNFGYQPVGPNIHPSIVKAVQRQVEEARATAPPPLFVNNPIF